MEKNGDFSRPVCKEDDGKVTNVDVEDSLDSLSIVSKSDLGNIQRLVIGFSIMMKFVINLMDKIMVSILILLIGDFIRTTIYQLKKWVRY